MLIAELYKHSDSGKKKGFNNTESIRDGLALAAVIIKKHKAGSTSVQIAMDCGCSLNDVENIVKSI